jgi:hypothetical protein
MNEVKNFITKNVFKRKTVVIDDDHNVNMPISPIKAKINQEKKSDTNKIKLIKNQIKGNIKSCSKSSSIKSENKQNVNSSNKNRSFPLKKDVYNVYIANTTKEEEV